ncbi:hypothetical protein [Vineibacter terrae]|uniref:hypothetical protein n=1 Tax=Vineibacter terrae TaxID=2586908 RepID=UPI002E31EB93|nr:hypothetical protein [Vineibacter terrae]HEX2886122.1 hypothetical protein [Vineibacter terrae]
MFRSTRLFMLGVIVAALALGASSLLFFNDVYSSRPSTAELLPETSSQALSLTAVAPAGSKLRLSHAGPELGR